MHQTSRSKSPTLSPETQHPRRRRHRRNEPCHHVEAASRAQTARKNRSLSRCISHRPRPPDYHACHARGGSEVCEVARAPRQGPRPSPNFLRRHAMLAARADADSARPGPSSVLAQGPRCLRGVEERSQECALGSHSDSVMFGPSTIPTQAARCVRGVEERSQAQPLGPRSPSTRDTRRRQASSHAFGKLEWAVRLPTSARCARRRLQHHAPEAPSHNLREQGAVLRTCPARSTKRG
mmetsp:Transcript_34468/g.112233  ORF Transcript_34468/g.112233 Transcript_34468/m.112233 type:complete len:237 (+) Transcript_34468:1667-2377(+)